MRVPAQPWSRPGFAVLDDALEGGFRSGELVLLGGPQGLGKTTMVMQMIRNVVRGGGSAVIFSYEHEAHTLLERLLSLEASLVEGPDAARLPAIRGAFEKTGPAGLTLDDRLAHLRGVPEGLRTLRTYAGRLHIHESTGSTTDLEEIRRTVSMLQTDDAPPPLVVVDYLQKVPVPNGPAIEEERVTLVVERLKDLTLDLGVPILAIVAADKASLVSGKRMRVHDLRGSSALAYEADVVLILNDKYDVVARHHLVYDLGNAERYKQWVDHDDREEPARCRRGRARVPQAVRRGTVRGVRTVRRRAAHRGARLHRMMRPASHGRSAGSARSSSVSCIRRRSPESWGTRPGTAEVSEAYPR